MRADRHDRSPPPEPTEVTSVDLGRATQLFERRRRTRYVPPAPTATPTTITAMIHGVEVEEVALALVVVVTLTVVVVDPLVFGLVVVVACGAVVDVRGAESLVRGGLRSPR